MHLGPYNIKGLLIDRYDIYLLTAAQSLHEYVTGSNECYNREQELFAGFLEARLENWHEGRSEFDVLVKLLCETALKEYKNSWLIGIQSQEDLPACIKPTQRGW